MKLARDTETGGDDTSYPYWWALIAVICKTLNISSQHIVYIHHWDIKCTEVTHAGRSEPNVAASYTMTRRHHLFFFCVRPRTTICHAILACDQHATRLLFNSTNLRDVHSNTHTNISDVHFTCRFDIFSSNLLRLVLSRFLDSSFPHFIICSIGLFFFYWHAIAFTHIFVSIYLFPFAFNLFVCSMVFSFTHFENKMEIFYTSDVNVVRIPLHRFWTTTATFDVAFHFR